MTDTDTAKRMSRAMTVIRTAPDSVYKSKTVKAEKGAPAPAKITTGGKITKPSPNRYLKPEDATRRDLSKQIVSLKRKIEENLRRVSNLYRRGEYDKAALQCSIIAQHRTTIQNLGEIVSRKIVEEKEARLSRPRPSPFRIVVKEGRKATVFDQAMKNRNTFPKV